MSNSTLKQRVIQYRKEVIKRRDNLERILSMLDDEISIKNHTEKIEDLNMQINELENLINNKTKK